MLGALAFVSLAKLVEPADHHSYNEWHQLDHRPENLALPSVAWGERWVRSPDCAGTGSLADFHYLNLYWLRAPVEEARAAFAELAERSLHWGRRDDLRLCTRPMMGWFVPVAGAVAPRVRLSVDALPIRPNRGAHVEIVRFADGRSADAVRWFDWYEGERRPAVLAQPGVTGTFAFADEPSIRTHRDLAATDDPSTTRVHVTYLDADPTTVALDPLPAGDGVDVRFSGVVRSISPWAWDWFER